MPKGTVVNYNYSDWKPENRKRGGEFDFDVFRLNVNASYKKFDLAADYRFYPASSGGGMLREGWIGYSPPTSNEPPSCCLHKFPK